MKVEHVAGIGVKNGGGRKGDWMRTVSGARFWPLDPRLEEIDIDDIAHALSKQCRFAGHTSEFYSVAEHCVRVSDWIANWSSGNAVESAFYGLLHDASEAYLTDVPRPVKIQPEFAFYREAEAVLEGMIFLKYGLPAPVAPSVVKQADNILLATEARDLMGNPQDWTSLPSPLPERIEPWKPYRAYGNFMARFLYLMDKIKNSRDAALVHGAQKTVLP